MLTILANLGHIATIFGGQASVAGLVMTLANLVSEPAGAVACVLTFANLDAGKTRSAARLQQRSQQRFVSPT